jgi:hypothetical protein
MTTNFEKFFSKDQMELLYAITDEECLIEPLLTYLDNKCTTGKPYKEVGQELYDKLLRDFSGILYAQNDLIPSLVSTLIRRFYPNFKNEVTDIEQREQMLSLVYHKAKVHIIKK